MSAKSLELTPDEHELNSIIADQALERDRIRKITDLVKLRQERDNWEKVVLNKILKINEEEIRIGNLADPYSVAAYTRILALEKQVLEGYRSYRDLANQLIAQITGTWQDVLPEPVIVTPEPVIVTPEPVIVTPEPVIVTPPPIDDSINTNMVTQQVINFNIVNGRAVGSIKFVATNNFNPYWYNKEIINLVQFKTPNGVTLLVKENRLRFTQTERDELINYNESIQENTRITIESFVWEWMDKPAGAFSNKYSIDISEKEPPKPVSSGFMGAGIAGAIASLILIGFIADHKRGK